MRLDVSARAGRGGRIRKSKVEGRLTTVHDAEGIPAAAKYALYLYVWMYVR